MIALEKIRALPRTHQATIPPEYLDEMGHMNIRWYIALFDQAAWTTFRLIGADYDFMQAHQSGVFALKQFIQYFAEVRVGEKVSIYSRFLGRSDKRLHKIHFMVNDDKDVLASTIEVIATHIDMTTRRSAVWLPELTGQLDALIAAHQRLDWDAPLCGVLSP